MLLNCGVGEDSWVPWTVRIQPVNPKGNQSWIFIGRTDAEAETPILWPPDVNNWLIWKDPDAGKDWRQEDKGSTEDEMVGWHHWLNGQEFEQALGDGDGQGSLACCSPWGRKESDTIEQLNWTECPNKNLSLFYIGLEYKHWMVKITADGDCSHEIKICLLLEKKAMTNLDSILKSRDITLPTNVL